MFHHVKELQFNARVTRPDPRFAGLLLEQFGGGNGELKAAMQYFVQAFTCRRAFPDKYDLLMDIATEEFSHLEIVGATITMLLEGVNGELKDAVENMDWMKIMNGNAPRDEMIHQVAIPQFFILSGGGPTVTDSQGVPWNGHFVNANGDLSVDLRSNIGAECRAKIVYEYLSQHTDDPEVKKTLRFLMTREIAHLQMFTAALETVKPNFPPGVLQGDPRHTHTYFNLSNGAEVRGPWNEGQGPWPEGEEWQYIDKPTDHVVETDGERDLSPQGTETTDKDVAKMDATMSRERSDEIKKAAPKGVAQWSDYPQDSIEAPNGKSSKKKAAKK